MSGTYRTAAEAARAAAEAIRALNHLTLSAGSDAGWETPGDAYDVVGSLVALVERLPQSLDQVAGLVAGLDAAGMLRHDSDPECLSSAVSGVRDGAFGAGLWLGDASGCLSDMHAALGHLGYQGGGDLS